MKMFSFQRNFRIYSKFVAWIKRSSKNHVKKSGSVLLYLDLTCDLRKNRFIVAGYNIMLESRKKRPVLVGKKPS